MLVNLGFLSEVLRDPGIKNIDPMKNKLTKANFPLGKRDVLGRCLTFDGDVF